MCVCDHKNIYYIHFLLIYLNMVAWHSIWLPSHNDSLLAAQIMNLYQTSTSELLQLH